MYTYNTMKVSRGFTLSFTLGFTLVELLVVISIIGLLAGIVLSSLNSARAKGRDARRVSDIKQLQLALTLYYLLSAYAMKSHVHEQQAMSIALKCLHEHPFMTAAVPRETHVERFTVTLEPQSVDEIGRLWLALASPLSLSAVYRAEVIFLAPEEPTTPAKGIVLEPHVRAFTTQAAEGPLLASPPTSTSVAIVTGAGFDASTIELRIGGLTLTVVPSGPLAPGQALVVSPSELQVRLPAGTRRGRYLLHVSLSADGPVEDVVLDIEQDVP